MPGEGVDSAGLVNMKKPRDLTALAREIDGNLRAIRRTLRKPLASEIARGDLTVPQRNIMEILVHSDGLSLKELSGQAGLAHSTVSGIVDRLEKRGMLARQADVKDARFSRIVVTDEVREFVREKIPALAMQPLVTALHRASPGQRARIVQGLRTLRRVLDAD
jgi:DNA-binding MarR family transcriptional regulator